MTDAFTRMDRDGDGVITRAEFERQMQGVSPGGSLPGAPQGAYPTYGNPFVRNGSSYVSSSMPPLSSFPDQRSSFAYSQYDAAEARGADSSFVGSPVPAMPSASMMPPASGQMYTVLGSSPFASAPPAYPSAGAAPMASMPVMGAQTVVGGSSMMMPAGSPTPPAPVMSPSQVPVYMAAPQPAPAAAMASYAYAPAAAQTSVQQNPEIMDAIHADQDVIRFEPEYYERIVEVPKIEIENVERIVEVPQPQIVDRIVEVPQVQEVITEVPGPVDVQIITREVPKIEVRQVERIVEVPQVEFTDRVVEVPEVHEIVRRIPRIEVHEIPIERVIKVPKKIYQEVEQPIFRPVPHLVQQAVERDIPVARTQVQTMEVVKQVAVPTYQGVPINPLPEGFGGATAPAPAAEAPPQNWYSVPPASMAQSMPPPPSVPLAAPPSMPIAPAPQPPVGASCMASMAVPQAMTAPAAMASMGQIPQTMGSGVLIGTPPTPPAPVGPPAPAAPQSSAGLKVGTQFLVKKGTFTPPGSMRQASAAPSAISNVPSMASQVLASSAALPPAAVMGSAAATMVTRPGYSTPPTPPVAAGQQALGSQTFIAASPMQSGLVSGTINYPPQSMGSVPANPFASGQPGAVQVMVAPGSMPPGSVASLNPFGTAGSVAAPPSQMLASGPNPFASGAPVTVMVPPGTQGPPGSVLQSGVIVPPGSSRVVGGPGTPPTPPNGGALATFNALDQNGDGAISRAEFNQAMSSMRGGQTVVVG